MNIKHDAFQDRERALEGSFFSRVDAELMAELRQRLLVAQALQRLSEATGFTDPQLLRDLVELGVKADAVAVLEVAPLVLAAWADGCLDQKERKMILQAASAQGISLQSAAGRQLECWLDTRPGPELESAWRAYMKTTTASLSEAERNELRQHLTAHARTVIAISDGLPGLGCLSPKERQFLAGLEFAF
ncbi:hypothetical protein [Lignipirellula cremea]|uniref:Co-chaperone DjlA N-terminal domain-containing protein n=1 Tax=Lignipirellula cremea TaxID=2528010 RepID=A0A518DQ30_9BACT|nr:hypothetical protein [Lignipirellula cremea]QDU93955.1 hypothetical protein Pla8534_17410 [Lignipirellula cremea]